MKKLVVSLAIVLALCSPGHAQEGVFSLAGANYLRTTLVATTDSNQMFTAAFATAYGSTVDWSLVKAILITCETYDARLAFGVTAENDASPVGHILYVGQSMRIASLDQIRSLRIISKTAGSAASLQVSLER